MRSYVKIPKSFRYGFALRAVGVITLRQCQNGLECSFKRIVEIYFDVFHFALNLRAMTRAI